MVQNHAVIEWLPRAAALFASIGPPVVAPPSVEEARRVMEESVPPDTARIPVLNQCAEKAIAALRRAGFAPEIEQLANGHTRLVVRGLVGDGALRAAAAVPLSCFAGQRGIVHRFVTRK